MYEYDILNIYDNTEKIIFGYDLKDAMRRSKLNIEEWKVLRSEYVD